MKLLPGHTEAGVQTPRVFCQPASAVSEYRGDDAIELAALAGLDLDPWQQLSLRKGLATDDTDHYAALEVAEIVSRQNGKGGVLEALTLYWLFLAPDTRIVHSAHEFKTAVDGFNRVVDLVENCDMLRKRCKKPSRSHGDEGITTLDGASVRYFARSKGSGRGFPVDKVIMDEALILDERASGAMFPMMASRPDPLLWYASSAAFAYSVVLKLLRKRALTAMRTGTPDPSLCLMEWSAGERGDVDVEALKAKMTDEDPAVVAEAAAEVLRLARLANPAQGIRISDQFVLREFAGMIAEEFGRERFSLSANDDEGVGPIPVSAFTALGDPESKRTGRVHFAIDVTPDQAWGSLGVAGRRADGIRHLEVVEHKRGIDWIVDRVVEVRKKRPSGPVVLDATSPAGALMPDLAERGVPVLAVSGADLGKACARLKKDTTNAAYRWKSPDEGLIAALQGATQRNIGDGLWAWSRKNSAAVISPLVAVTLANWGAALDSDRPPNLW